MDISDRPPYAPLLMPPPPPSRTPRWVWVVVAAAGAFVFLIVGGIVVAVAIPVVLAHHEVSSAQRTCDTLSDQDRLSLLGGPTGGARHEVGADGRPGGCLWTATGSPAGGRVELVATSPQQYRTVIAQVAAGARAAAPSGSPVVRRLDALSHSPIRSCVLIRRFARVVHQPDSDPVVLVAAPPGGTRLVTAITCTRGRVIQLSVAAGGLDTSTAGQDRVSGMLILVEQRLT